MNINIEKIKIKVKVIEGQKMKAIISLDFGDFVVKGFRIRESEHENSGGDKLWLTPPAYLGGGRYHPIFFVPDKELWGRLEEKIFKEYHQQSEDHYKKRFELDEIPDLNS